MKLSLEYAAGLFDGEGFFNIDRTQRRDCKSPSFQVHARITMRDRVLICALQETFGGSVRQCKNNSPKHAEYYSWDVCGEEVVLFVDAIAEHLIIKKPQAKHAKRFQEYKRQNKNQPNTPDRVSNLEYFHEYMKSMNQKGVSR
jgi:hypothetical protein